MCPNFVTILYPFRLCVGLDLNTESTDGSEKKLGALGELGVKSTCYELPLTIAVNGYHPPL